MPDMAAEGYGEAARNDDLFKAPQRRTSSKGSPVLALQACSMQAYADTQDQDFVGATVEMGETGEATEQRDKVAGPACGVGQQRVREREERESETESIPVDCRDALSDRQDSTSPVFLLLTSTTSSRKSTLSVALSLWPFIMGPSPAYRRLSPQAR